jgi:hypothetical protein
MRTAMHNHLDYHLEMTANFNHAMELDMNDLRITKDSEIQDKLTRTPAYVTSSWLKMLDVK